MAMLKQFFRDCLKDTEKLVILGAGSCLKADDAAGIEVASRLIKKYSEACSPRLRVYHGSTAPENYTGAIRAFRPGHIIIIDAADVQEVPGSVSVIQPDVISGVSFSTHMLPLKVLIDYLQKEIGCDVTVIGIQPQDLSFGSPMTVPVRKAVVRVKNALKSVLLEKGMLPSR
jgi:hydrogenase 3 maturation protease